MRFDRVFAVVLLACSGCAEDRLVGDPNMPPTANAGPDQSVPYAGVPVMVTLDGSLSFDPDGRIAQYRWLSATKPPDGGPGRYVPPGDTPDWPPNEVRPSVLLPQGLWVFALQVIDEKGATSVPDYVTVAVGVALPVAGTGGMGAGGSTGTAGAQAVTGGTGGSTGGAGGAGAGGAGAGAGGTGGGAGASAGTSGAGAGAGGM